MKKFVTISTHVVDAHESSGHLNAIFIANVSCRYRKCERVGQRRANEEQERDEKRAMSGPSMINCVLPRMHELGGASSTSNTPPRFLNHSPVRLLSAGDSRFFLHLFYSILLVYFFVFLATRLRGETCNTYLRNFLNFVHAT